MVVFVALSKSQQKGHRFALSAERMKTSVRHAADPYRGLGKRLSVWGLRRRTWWSQTPDILYWHAGIAGNEVLFGRI